MAPFAIRLQVCMLIALLAVSAVSGGKGEKGESGEKGEKGQPTGGKGEKGESGEKGEKGQPTEQDSQKGQPQEGEKGQPKDQTEHKHPQEQKTVTAPPSAPAPAPPAKPLPCFRTRTKYEPIDMAGEPRTKTDRAEQCQERCAKVSGCVHFTWYEDKGCHLQDAHANRARGKSTAMSGPPDCAVANFCFRNGWTYKPVDMSGHKRSDTIDAGDCQMRCSNSAGCTSFVWFPDGGCHIQDSKAKRVEGHSNIVSGGPDCDPTTTVTTVTTTATTTKTHTTTKTSTTKTQTHTTTQTKTTTTLTTTSKTKTTTTKTKTTKTETTSVTTATTTKTSTTKTKTTSTKTTTTMTTSVTTATTTKTSVTSTSSLTTTTSVTTLTRTSTSSLTTTTSPPNVCLLPATQFQQKGGGLMMKGTKREVASSPYLCQSKCRKTKGCVHFSWWGDGGCHLQDGDAKPEKADSNAVAGPTSCHDQAYCFENRHKWHPLIMHGTARTTEASPDTCQAKCEKTEGCSHFTFWSDGGCHLQDEKATRQDADNLVTAGPKSCDRCWRCEDGYFPAENNIESLTMTPEQARYRCINQGCKGFTFKGSEDETGLVKVFVKSTKSGDIDPDSQGRGWTACVPEEPAENGECAAGGGQQKQEGHKGGQQTQEDHKGGTKEEDHKGGAKEEDHKGGTEQEDHKGGTKEEDHKGGAKEEDQKGGAKEEDHKGGTEQEDHKGGTKEEDHKGGDKEGEKGGSEKGASEEESKGAKGKEDESAKGKTLQRLFAVDDREEAVEFPHAPSSDSLPGFAAAAGLLLVAGAAAVGFHRRRPAEPTHAALWADEAPDDVFEE